MNASNNIFAKNIIARYVPEEFRCIAFFADEEPKNTVKAYIEGKGVVTLDKAVYDRSERLHPSDEQKVAEMYKQNTGVQDITIRHRMPYKKQASLLAQRLSGEIGTKVDEKPLQNVPVEQQPVIVAMAEKRKPGRPKGSRSDVAKQRMMEDEARAAAVSLAAVKDAPQDVKEKAVDELARKIAAILSSAI